MAILDPDLEILLAKKRFLDEHPVEGKTIDPAKTIFIAIEFKEDVSALEGVGFKIGNVIGAIAFGSTNLQGLINLNNHQNVVRISKQKNPYPLLDKSIPAIKADKVRSWKGDHFEGKTGKGVIIGVIDSGIDFRHRAFQNSDGTTRILRIWDQTLVPTGLDEESPGEIELDKLVPKKKIALGYGVEYRKEVITQTLKAEREGTVPAVPVRHVPGGKQPGHGTHVAGIAAGNGSQRGACKGDYSYIGVAPEADIIMVRRWEKKDATDTAPAGSNVILDAISYIIHEARVVAKEPVVVNISLGLFTIEMDGNSPNCVAIDKILKAYSDGSAVVIAAGNEADKLVRASLVIAGNATKILPFTIQEGDREPCQLVFLYTGSNLKVRLTSPKGENSTVYATSPQTIMDFIINGIMGDVTISNQPNQIIIDITPPEKSPGPPPVYKPNKFGEWKIEFVNTTAAETRVEGFAVGRYEKRLRFADGFKTALKTLTNYATCREAITVGAVDISTGKLADFSSCGPTLDGRRKPDICAPGVAITAPSISTVRQKEDDSDYACFKSCCCDCCLNFYIDMEGTSMAAPHVAGLAALMLENNVNLNHEQIKTILMESSQSPPDGTGNEALEGWGSGMVDAEEAIGIKPSDVDLLDPGLEFATLPPNPFDALHTRFMNTERGPSLVELAQKYFGEIRMMINRNKRVATVWHRCQGPAWVRIGMKSFYNPDFTIPESVNGINFRECVQKLLTIVKRYASESLLKDLTQYESLLSKLSTGMCLNEFVDLVGGKSMHSEEQTFLLMQESKT